MDSSKIDTVKQYFVLNKIDNEDSTANFNW